LGVEPLLTHKYASICRFSSQ